MSRTKTEQDLQANLYYMSTFAGNHTFEVEVKNYMKLIVRVVWSELVTENLGRMYVICFFGTI